MMAVRPRVSSVTSSSTAPIMGALVEMETLLGGCRHNEEAAEPSVARQLDQEESVLPYWNLVRSEYRSAPQLVKMPRSEIADFCFSFFGI